MPRFAANLSMLYNELDFLDRFAAAASDGFTAVEYLFPYAWAPEQLSALLREHGLRQVLFNAPPGEWDAGERGLACIPGREGEFHAGLERAIAYARALDCPRIHVMAGLMPAGVDAATLRATYVANLRGAAEQAAPHGIDILIEPINPRDMPGYVLNRQDEAQAAPPQDWAGGRADLGRARPARCCQPRLQSTRLATLTVHLSGPLSRYSQLKGSLLSASIW